MGRLVVMRKKDRGSGKKNLNGNQFKSKIKQQISSERKREQENSYHHSGKQIGRKSYLASYTIEHQPYDTPSRWITVWSIKIDVWIKFRWGKAEKWWVQWVEIILLWVFRVVVGSILWENIEINKWKYHDTMDTCLMRINFHLCICLCVCSTHFNNEWRILTIAMRHELNIIREVTSNMIPERLSFNSNELRRAPPMIRKEERERKR